MVSKLIIKKSKLEEVFILAPLLREDDKRECQALNKYPLEALKDGFKYSEECYTAYTEDNKPVGMFGYARVVPNANWVTVWFLGTDEMIKHPVQFLKEGRKFIKKVLKKDNIFNYIYAENTAHIDYVKRLGLIVDTENPVFNNGNKFYKFYKNKE